MKLKLTWLMTLLMAFVIQISYAQERSVSGKITSALDGLPVPGVNIIVKGTTRGVQSDFDGNYTIRTSANETLVFSFVGLKTEERNVGANSTINVQMTEDAAALEEVVIVGYGVKETETQKSGSYTTVGASEISSVPVASFDQALQGRVAGLQVGTISGQPGAFTPVFLRGVSSLTADTNPLYVINGVPVLSGDNSVSAATSNPLASINPSDIQDVTVLKDAMATSIYGSRGANGVILITTKSGKKDTSRFTLSTEYGFGDVAFDEHDWLSAEEHVQLVALGRINSGLAASQEAALEFATTFLNWDGVTNTDWREATRNKQTVTNTTNLSYSGGSENFQIYSSLGYFEQEGISREAKYERISGNLNTKWQASERLDLGFAITLTSAKQTGDSDASSFRNPVFTGSLLSPTNPIFNEDGTYNLSLTYLNPTFNPVAIQNTDVISSKFYKILANINLNYDIIKNTFSFQSLAGVDMNIYDEITYWNPDFGDGVNAGDVNGNGNGFKDDRFRRIWTWQNSLNFNKTFNDLHTITATAGIEAVADQLNVTSAAAQGYLSGRYDLYELGNAANPTGASSSYSDNTFYGLFARGSYTFDRRYALTGSYRRDGSSRFGLDKQYGDFYAGGFTWNIDNEKFLESASFINRMKLRLTYGITGNANIGNHAAKALVGFGDYLSTNAAVITSPGNTDLTWESKKTTNIGLDFGFWNNKVSGSIDFYKNESEELLFNAPSTPSSGFTTITQNIGTTENRGIEVQLSLTPFDGDFKWRLHNTFSYNKNEVTKITNETDEIAAAGVKNYAVGHDPSEFYTRLWAGVNPADGTPLWYTDETRTAVTGNVNNAELSFTGKHALPSYLASVSNEFEYKNFNLKFLFNYAGDLAVWDRWAFVYDNDGAFANLNHLASNLYDSWTPDNRLASKPKYLFNSANNLSSTNSTRYIYDGDYIRLRSIELGYRMDSNKELKNVNWIDSMYIYVRGLNLYTYVFDDDLYFDPEVGSNAYATSLEGAGVYDATAPNLKQFLFGVNINF